MTREQIKEMLPIIQAFAEGKTIELLRHENVWKESFDLDFSAPRSYYRIKPREFWLIKIPGKNEGYMVWDTKPQHTESIKVTETL